MKSRFLAVGLLLLMAWLELSTLAVTSLTADEPTYMVRGYAFIKEGKDRILSCDPCSPILSGAMIGTSLLMEPDLQLPAANDPIWYEGSGFDVHQTFIWSNTVPFERIAFWGRLPIIFLSLILGAFIFRWASQRSGTLPAVGALLLYVFCPNILAHARLATTDLVAAATFTISVYVFDRVLHSPRDWRLQLGSGLALGLALASKNSAAWLPVAFVILTVVYFWRDRRARRTWSISAITLFVTYMVGGLTLWTLYRFSVGPVVPGGLPLPAPAYWQEWIAISNYLNAPFIPAYLFGQISQTGWWYYYPITFLVKTPLPVLIFLGLALFQTARKRSWRRNLPLLLAPTLYFASLLVSGHDLGYRYLLPVLPFIFVWSADVMAAAQPARWSRWAVGLLLIWQIVGTLSIYPYYLTYFNEIGGGPERGRYILSDSNLDWGQDLIGLKQYVDQHQIDHLRLSYFGIAHPTAYGLQTEGLSPIRDAMRDQGTWWLHTYYPSDPPPGLYAISVSNLMGGVWTDFDTYAYFRDRKPVATIGNSIYLYRIAPRSPVTANLSLAGLQIDQIDATTYQRFATNDVRPRWFDAGSSLIAAAGDTWLAIADNQPLAPELQSLLSGNQPVLRAKLSNEDRSYVLYHFDLAQHIMSAAQHTPVSMQPARFSETAELLGYEVQTSDRSTVVITYWRAGDQINLPLQMFVHVLGPDGLIVAQQDRLDATPVGWHPGDLVAQVTHLNRVLAPGDRLTLGLYDPDSGKRLPVTSENQVSDHLLLK